MWRFYTLARPLPIHPQKPLVYSYFTHTTTEPG